MKWVGHWACVGDRRGTHKVSLGRPEGKRAPGKPRHRWEDNIKMDFYDGCGGGMDWIDLTQDWNMAGACECGKGSIKCREFLD